MVQRGLAIDSLTTDDGGSIADASAAREAEIAARIDQWTMHMRWRKNYDRWREDRLWQEDTQLPRLRAIKRAAGTLSGKRVLDIGSGMGGFLVAAARNGMNAVGIEPNADYCRITRLRGARYRLAPSVIRGVGESLPFSTGSIDIVLAQDILEHVRDPDATLREMRRVLRPGGVALVTVINRFAWRDPHYHLRGINWLPRRWGERIVERVGRSKRGAAFTDNQRLSDMYYDTFGAFSSRAASLGFAAADMKEAQVRETKPDGNGRHAGMKRVLARTHLLVPVYRMHRFAVASTYEIALRPTAAEQ